MKRASMVALGCGTLFVGLGISVLVMLPVENIELYVNNNNITWTDKSRKNNLGDKYYIYNDEFLVNKVTENNYLLTKEKLIDEIGPDKIKKVEIDYTGNKIHLKWDEVQDLGTDNNIWVGLYSENERQVGYSNVVNINYASGVDNYVMEIGDKSFQLSDAEFVLDRGYLASGVTMAKVYAVDNRGNKGSVTTIPLYNYNIILSKEENTINFHIDDSTQNYKYKVYINGSDKGYVSNSDELNSILIDNESPNSITKLDIKTTNNKLNATWQEVVDNGSDYLVSVEAYGLKYYNTAYSDNISLSKKSEIKGYYYCINKKESYTITDKDTFITQSNVDYKGNYGDYYFHIAAVDSVGNISQTKTEKFSLINPYVDSIENGTSGDKIDSNDSNDKDNSSNNNTVTDSFNESEYLSIINKTLFLKGNISTYTYNKAIDLLKKVDLTDLKKLKENNIKIYLTDGSAEDLYLNFVGESLKDDITGIFVWDVDKPFIIVESAYIDSSLIHEIGHAIDYVYGKGNFLSDSKSFVDIYELEKDSLFTNDVYVKSSNKEYFAESYVKFCVEPYSLKNKAPKTYKYFKDNLN